MRLAAVQYDIGKGQDVDVLLADIAQRLKCRGWSLAGAVQANTPRADGCRCDMTLEDLASGMRISTTENRGPLARGCRLDVSALEEAVGLALSSLTPAVDLVIINRFGKREAEGRGFRPLIEAAASHDVPVLIGVNEAQCGAWQTFSGAVGTTLQPDLGAVLRWCEISSGHESPGTPHLEVTPDPTPEPMPPGGRA